MFDLRVFRDRDGVARGWAEWTDERGRVVRAKLATHAAEDVLSLLFVEARDAPERLSRRAKASGDERRQRAR